MLYGLQQVTNIIRVADWDDDWQDDYADHAGRALEFPDFEQKFGIPPGIDLEAEPEVALDAALGAASDAAVPQTEDHPELVKPVLQQPRPPQPAGVPGRASVRAARAGRSELTFEDLQQQLHDMQRHMRRSAEPDELKKRVASVSPETTEKANSA